MAICYRVASDGKEPTSETTGEVAGAITAEASERIGKDIASGILRLLPVAKAVIAEAENVIEVAIIKRPEGRAIVLGVEDEQRVRYGRSRPILQYWLRCCAPHPRLSCPMTFVFNRGNVASGLL